MIELRTGTVRILSPEVIGVRLKNTGDEMTVDDYSEMLDLFKKMTDGKPFATIIDGRDAFINFSPAVRHMNATHHYVVRFKMAEAVLTSSLPLRLTVNLYNAFNKPIVPTKVFPDETPAMIWLEERIARFDIEERKRFQGKGFLI